MICVIVSTTVKFNWDNVSLYYLLCNHCNKRTYETYSFKCTYYDQDNVMLIFKLVYSYLSY